MEEERAGFFKERALPIDGKGKTPSFPLNCKKMSPIEKQLVDYDIIKISYTFPL